MYIVYYIYTGLKLNIGGRCPSQSIYEHLLWYKSSWKSRKKPKVAIEMWSEQQYCLIF